MFKLDLKGKALLYISSIILLSVIILWFFLEAVAGRIAFQNGDYTITFLNVTFGTTLRISGVATVTRDVFAFSFWNFAAFLLISLGFLGTLFASFYAGKKASFIPVLSALITIVGGILVFFTINFIVFEGVAINPDNFSDLHLGIGVYVVAIASILAGGLTLADHYLINKKK